jgi:putative sterol carrier protein
LALSSIAVREFEEKDLPQITALYEDVSVRNPHFVRNNAFVIQFMNQFSVSEHKAFVTEKDGRLTGFVMVSVTIEQDGFKQGNILELQVKDSSSLLALVNAASDYCNLNDVDAIIAVAPPVPYTNKVFESWVKFDTGVMMTKTLAPAPLLEVLLSNERIRSLYAREKIAFHIGTDLVNIEITPTKAHVFQIGKTQNEAGARVFMSHDVFLKLVLGQLNPYAAYVKRKVKVKSAKNTFALLRLLSLIRIDRHFFASLSDRM